MKKTQLVMVWLLPVIVIGGLFNPWLGYLVVIMMAFFLTSSFFRGRYWCWNLCPRGSFLDIVVSKISRNKPFPGGLSAEWVRWSVFFLFMVFLTYRIIGSGGNLMAIGSVFVTACLVSTAIAVILGVTTKHRGWCVICPMGTLQEKIGKIRHRGR